MDRREFLERAALTGAGVALTTAALRSGDTGTNVEASDEARRRRRENLDSRPNVLLILTDDQPYYMMRYMEAVRERLIARGLKFTNAYVATPLCGPARAAILTGRWPHTTGLVRTSAAYERLKESQYEEDTIAVRLKRAGYDTGFFGKYTNGYDELRVPPGWNRWFAQLEPFNRPDVFEYNSNGDRRTFDRAADNETDVLRERAELFVRNHGRTGPWFCYVCPHSPHGPYYPAPRHAEEFSGALALEGVPSYNEVSVLDKPASVREGRIGAEEAKEIRRDYRGKLRELQEVDDLVAQLTRAISETRQADNTVVIFATDNGEFFGEHRLRAKNQPYEEATRTPLVMRGPGIAEGAICDALASHVDFAPTILELAGVDASERDNMDGRSLVRLFGGEVPPDWRRYLLVENPERGWDLVKNGRYAYVEWETGDLEMYDTVEDPYQLDGTIGSRIKEERARSLAERLALLRKCSGDSCRTAEST